ncbi:MAG: YaaA family protein [Candidatus Gracilibacteria bacterium]|nr:YaaA family protein [Candidatus Gracilibacteria bacterium]
MKLLFLIPPSEGKNTGGEPGKEYLQHTFEKPYEIIKSVTEKDLKCIGKRFEEGMLLNKLLCDHRVETEVHSAMERYTGVMYNAINYQELSNKGRIFFDNHFGILSGMYGLISPEDTIGNYKLPIETKGLIQFWKETISHRITQNNYDYIINLLPLSYMKMVDWKKLDTPILNINFLTEKNGKIQKVSHGVKKIKGEWIHNTVEKLGNRDPVSHIQEILESSGGEISKEKSGNISTLEIFIGE